MVIAAAASLGDAVTLTPGETMSHFRFKVTVNLKKNTVCKYRREILKMRTFCTTAPIVDEYSTVSQGPFEAIDRTLHDICSNDCPSLKT